MGGIALTLAGPGAHSCNDKHRPNSTSFPSKSFLPSLYFPIFLLFTRYYSILGSFHIFGCLSFVLPTLSHEAIPWHLMLMKSAVPGEGCEK